MSCVTVSRRTSSPPSYKPNVRETLALPCPCIALPSSFSCTLRQISELEVLHRLQHLRHERGPRPDERRAHRAGANANRRVVRPEATRVERVVGEFVAVAFLAGSLCGFDIGARRRSTGRRSTRRCTSCWRSTRWFRWRASWRCRLRGGQAACEHDSEARKN